MAAALPGLFVCLQPTIEPPHACTGWPCTRVTQEQTSIPGAATSTNPADFAVATFHRYPSTPCRSKQAFLELLPPLTHSTLCSHHPSPATHPTMRCRSKQAFLELLQQMKDEVKAATGAEL